MRKKLLLVIIFSIFIMMTPIIKSQITLHNYNKSYKMNEKIIKNNKKINDIILKLFLIDWNEFSINKLEGMAKKQFFPDSMKDLSKLAILKNIIKNINTDNYFVHNLEPGVIWYSGFVEKIHFESKNLTNPLKIIEFNVGVFSLFHFPLDTFLDPDKIEFTIYFAIADFSLGFNGLFETKIPFFHSHVRISFFDKVIGLKLNSIST